MKKFFYVISLIATFPTAFYLFGAITDDSAPRMAAKAAVGVVL